jgi:hypothetical protein
MVPTGMMGMTGSMWAVLQAERRVIDSPLDMVWEGR